MGKENNKDLFFFYLIFFFSSKNESFSLFLNRKMCNANVISTLIGFEGKEIQTFTH